MRKSPLLYALLLGVLSFANGYAQEEKEGAFEKALASKDLPEYLDTHPRMFQWMENHEKGLDALAQHARLDEVVEDHPGLLEKMADHPKAAGFLVGHPNLDNILACNPGALDKVLDEHPELAEQLAKHPKIEDIIEEHIGLVKVILAHPEAARALAATEHFGGIALHHPDLFDLFQKINSDLALPVQTTQCLKDSAEALKEANDPELAKHCEMFPALAYAISRHPESAMAVAKRNDLDEFASRYSWLVAQIAEQPGVAEALASHPKLDKVLAADPKGFGEAIATHPELAKLLAANPKIEEMTKDHPELLAMIAHHPEAAKALASAPHADKLAASHPRLARRLTKTRNAPAPVPALYQPLYGELSNALDAVQGFLASRPAQGQNDTIYLAEVADGAETTTLLDPTVLQGIPNILESLQALGINGVKIQIPYPLLLPEFPRASEYVTFYHNLAQEIRQRHMKIVVECFSFFTGINPVWSYNGLTMEAYTRELTTMAETILREMQPDELSLLNEPDTMQLNTGLDFSTANCVTLINTVLRTVPHGGTTKIAAGAGTWTTIDYFTAIAATPIDMIDVHLHPILGADMTTQMDAIRTLCTQNHKEFAASETWLHKENTARPGPGSTTTLRALETFSFWEPLDERFVYYTVEEAKLYHWNYCGYFPIKEFFYAYNTYGPATANLSYSDLLQLETQASKAARLAGQVSPLGQDVPPMLR